jgi:hypothetical protein
MTHQILADAGFADVDTEFEQFAVNTRCSPQWILSTQFANEFSDVFRHRRPPRSTVTDLPGPEHTKALAVPSDDGVGFDDDKSGPPAAPDRAQPCPQEAIRRRQFRALHGALENTELVPECEVLQLERRSRSEGGQHSRCQRVKCINGRAQNVTEDDQTPCSHPVRGLRQAQSSQRWFSVKLPSSANSSSPRLPRSLPRA